MERFIMQDLIAWKNRKDRKPLILLGARQIWGKRIFNERDKINSYNSYFDTFFLYKYNKHPSFAL